MVKDSIGYHLSTNERIHNMTDKPEPNKEYALTGKTGDACIANGSSWKESEVKKKTPTEDPSVTYKRAVNFLKRKVKKT